MGPDIQVTGDTYTIDGRQYPRLTRVLATREQEWLAAWRKRVGEVEAARVKEEAGDYGTLLHALTAAWDEGGERFMEMLLEDPDDRAVRATLTWGEWVKRAGIVWVAREHVLWSDKLRVAGTTDGVGRMLGERTLTIVDLKSGYLSDIVGMQLCGYKEMWNESHKGREKVERTLAIRIPRDEPDKRYVKEYVSGKYREELLKDIRMYNAMRGGRTWK